MHIKMGSFKMLKNKIESHQGMTSNKEWMCLISCSTYREKDITLNQFGCEFILHSYDISILAFFLSITHMYNLFRRTKHLVGGCVQTEVLETAALRAVTKGGYSESQIL